MKDKFLQKNFQLIEEWKENLSLMFDKINRRLCILKKIRNSEIYLQLKKIDNPYTPKIFFVAENFVIEEFIEGENLSEILERGIFSEEKIISILTQLCECLKILHKNKILHRDIKPSNIILQGEKIFLTDFGIARKIKNISESDTEWLGTRGYAPPEQFGFSQTDCRSDIYSLGVTLKLLQPKSDRLKKIIRKATNFNPADRFQSVDEILAELQGKNLVSRLKNFFVKPKETERKELEELLQKYFLSFSVKLPTVEEYRFQPKKYSLEKKLKYPDDFHYIYDTEVEADVAGMISFDSNIYAKLDEYIAQVLKMYEDRQLKNFFVYEPSQENFYHKINCEVEKRTEKIFRNLNLKLPLTLKEFTCSPDEINFDAKKYVSAVRTEFEELVKNESLHYQIYIRTQKTVRRNSDKKYGFHINEAADAFFGDILWAIKFFSETSDALRDDIQNLIRENYFWKLNQAFVKKADDIRNYLLKN